MEKEIKLGNTNGSSSLYSNSGLDWASLLSDYDDDDDEDVLLPKLKNNKKSTKDKR